MPHQCTNCGRGFEDGSQEMLSGCPNCGGNKFQFRPEGADDSAPTDAEPPEPPEPPGGNSTVAKTVGKTAATVRDIVGSDEPSVGAEPADSSDPISAGPTDTEDAAQASARGEVVSPDELPDHDAESGRQAESVAGDAVAGDADEDRDRPDLKELREELNNQFESVKVVAPGQYELNLMELYDREEYIVALQEDGRYSIQVPEPIKE
ncbi:OapC/ArvC family zinc-ribbon domain-containing protein [Haloarcula onubensis]|uniref:Zn-ribbon domain-containing protein n=1 Tax=Haloarcula onubensis TaxID=2950539 RepID=A0ABU2FP75_9EURY|nr:Zn-ribbon containing protein [Halomicroarcula sp. S3CR25-11]MDS0282569.1 Zn-ribbon domain-containing protein [Halomicroarcula sp. S3CR25-11]